MVEQVLRELRERMDKTLVNTQSELTKIRTGRANLSLLDIDSQHPLALFMRVCFEEK